MVDERVQVQGGQGRCPFCHDQVPLEERVACAGCLAGHHVGCWEEHGRCSSCGHSEALRRAEPAESSQAVLERLAKQEANEAKIGLVVLVVLAVLAVAGGLYLGLA